MKNNNASGFTMIETAISLVVLSGVLYLVAQQTGQFSKIQMKANYDVEVQEASKKIEAALSDPQICTTFVAGTTIGHIAEGPPTLSPGGNSTTTGGINIPRVGQAIGGNIHTALKIPPIDSGSEATIVAAENENITLQLKVNSLQLVNDGVKNFIRVVFIPTGAAGGNAMRINRDFLIMGKKNAAQQITSCSLEPETASSLHCRGLVDHQWNAATQKCDVISRLKKGRTMIKIFASPSGGMMTEHLEPSTTVKKCECSSLRCSYRPNCYCNVGSCPSGQKIETPSRRVTVGQRVGKKCEMHAQCFNVIPIPPSTEPLGYIIGP